MIPPPAVLEQMVCSVADDALPVSTLCSADHSCLSSQYVSRARRDTDPNEASTERPFYEMIIVILSVQKK